MDVWSKAHVQQSGITFMGFDAFFCTVREVIVNCLMKGVGEFGDALALKVHKTIYTFYFTEKYAVSFAESY